MRELLITPQFRKDSRKIPNDVLEQADLVLLKLRKNPFDNALNIGKLKNFKPAIWRVRIGVYRIKFNLTSFLGLLVYNVLINKWFLLCPAKLDFVPHFLKINNKF